MVRLIYSVNWLLGRTVDIVIVYNFWLGLV